MVGSSQVTDPDGKTWTVRRRWYPWRRALSLSSIWHSTPDGDKADKAVEDAKATDPKSGESEASGNPFLNAILATVGVILWLVITAGKAVLILLAAVVAIILSFADLILRLLVMPFVLLARLCGVMRWPVQVNRDHQFVGTQFADGFDAAAALREDLIMQIQRGEFVADPVTSP